MDTSAAPDPRVQSDCSIACLRRRAWAQSRDSIWQESKPQSCGPEDSQQNQRDGDAQRPSEEPGRVPNKIANWLSECRTPLGASLDDQSASPSRGALRNGCSFEDDLSLGAEANHLQSSNKKTDSCFGLVAEQKRSQYKERGRSMNSTGSGKSSTVSRISEVLEQTEEHPEEVLLNLRVSELLDLYEEDPEEILLNLGFGREEPDVASKVPSRFFNSSSLARGIDIKVYLGAQMQRMELENPNYALTSRFRQIEVLTTVANEFFQLYSQVSGQPVQRISTREQGGDVGEKGTDQAPPGPKRTNSALNVAKLLKKTITKHNLLASASESPEANTPKQHAQLSGHTPPDHTQTNSHAQASPEQDCSSTEPDHQVETVSQKHIRKKDSCSLATVTEETNGDGETDWLPNNSPEQSSTEQAANGKHQKEANDLQSTGQTTEEGSQVVKEEKSLTSTPVKAPHALAPPQLAQLRTENADSFDMEEIQSNDDEGLPSRTSRGTDLSVSSALSEEIRACLFNLLRTVSQQSDSSGFAEEPSADSNSYLKVQESSDSCDSETTVTSHPSQDVATPLAVEQPMFELPDFKEEESEPGVAAEVDGRSNSGEEDEHDGCSEQVPQYTAHYFPRNKLMVTQLDESKEEEPAVERDLTNPKPEIESDSQAEPTPEPEVSHSVSTVIQEPQDTQNQAETVTNTETTTECEKAEDQIQEEHVSLDTFDVSCLPAPSSPVIRALNRANQTSLFKAGVQVDPNTNSSDTPQSPGRGRGRRMFLQRSSSLPSSLLAPSRVVSSVRIQFGQGQTSCTQPRYSFRYSPEAEDEKEDEEDGQANCLSTLIIKPASNNQSQKPPTDASIPPKPIPRYLLRSSCSLRSSSPPDWSPGSHTQFWSTQSIPDVSSNQQPSGHFQQNNLNQQNWNSGQMFSHPNPNPNPVAPYINNSPNTSPSLNPSPYPLALNPLCPSPLQPYTSLPNLHHHYSHSLNHHSSLTSLHHPATPTIPHHSSLSDLHQPPSSIAPHHFSVDNMHSGTPVMQHPGYNNTYSHQSPYHATPHNSQFSSPYLGYRGYSTNPHLGFPQSIPQYPLLPPQHGLHPGLAPPAPGFLPDLGHSFGQGHGLYPGFASPTASGSGSSHGPSSTEMQLRRVLHDIRGTVQSLNQNQANTPDMFREDLSIHQFLSELHQKRHSLNLFRSQMMDLELSIMQQQALVYKHLSPADRLEVEQLQSLRSAVREELLELEQQLEHRLTPHRVLPRGGSVDSLSTTSALKAMEPVSDLLKEQLFLQSELSDDGRMISTNPSSRSSSPVLGRGEQNQGVYRTSINITPAPPPRANINTEEEAKEEGERDAEARDGALPKAEGAAGGGRVENLQQLIREIRESVAQEVRREIYSELLAAVSPHQSSLSARQHPL